LDVNEKDGVGLIILLPKPSLLSLEMEEEIEEEGENDKGTEEGE
jgi:hypothetical protein